MYIILNLIIFFSSCFISKCCYKKDNKQDNILEDEEKDKKEDSKEEKEDEGYEEDKKEDEETFKRNKKQYDEEINKLKDIYCNDNGTSPFKWYDVNCTLKSTITEFNNLCNYIPEIIERIKDENNIIKDSIGIGIKNDIINEILNQRQQYLELKKGINVDILLNLIIKYIEITIKTIKIEDLYLQKYKDLIYTFDNMFNWTSLLYNNLKKYLNPIIYFAEINNEQDDDTKKTELGKFLKIRNNIDLEKNDNSSNITLFQFLNFINNYIVQFIDKKERKNINNGLYYDCYTIKNNKIKIYDGFKKNINYKNIINNNINNIISINLTGRYSSTLTHSISIQKFKDKFYFDSYNYYCNVSKDDIINCNFKNMFEKHGKLTLKNTFEYIDYIVSIF